MSNTVGNGNGNGQTATDTNATAAGTSPTLVCPDDATQALVWLPAAHLTLTRAYDQLPPPDAGKLRELAVSIAREGLLQPLLVTPSADGMHYEVVVGRRRWLVASTTGATVPALVRHFSPRQKYEAFLAAHVCTVVPATLEALTTAYDTTWTSVPEESASDAPDAAHAVTDSSGTDEAASVAAVVAQMRQLSPFVYRHLARELVTSDATLWDNMLADARQHLLASDASERERVAQELATAQGAVREAEQQQQRQSQTLTLLGQQLTDARMRYQRSEEQRQDSERYRQELTTENRQLQMHVQHLRTRLDAVGPVDHVAARPHLAALVQAAMEVVAAAGAPLVTHAMRVLNPRTARDATAALSRALDVVEERIRRCRRCLTEDGILPTADDAVVLPEVEVTR